MKVSLAQGGVNIMMIQNGMLKGVAMHVDSVSGGSGQNSFLSTMQEEKKQTKGSIYGGNLNHVTDSLAEKKQQAREQAMKIMGDAWAGEQEIDADIEARRAHIRELKSEIGACNKEIQWFEGERERLQEVYGVSDNSREQQDLELLAKEIDSKTPGKQVSLTKEEREQIERIKADGLTEYQTRSLELKESAQDYEVQKYKLGKEIETENAIITATRIERLKSDPMGDARKQADAVLEAASEEIVGMVLDAAVKHVDEKLEEQIKDAKERAEEKELQEEQLESIREKQEAGLENAGQSRRKQTKVSEEIVETSAELTDIDGKQAVVQKELQEVMDKMKLLAEDIKGIKVDETI